MIFRKIVEGGMSEGQNNQNIKRNNKQTIVR